MSYKERFCQKDEDSVEEGGSEENAICSSMGKGDVGSKSVIAGQSDSTSVSSDVEFELLRVLKLSNVYANKSSHTSSDAQQHTVHGITKRVYCLAN